MRDVLKIHPSDNAAVCLRDIPAGECLEVGGSPVTALEAIPAGHKIALTNIPEGEKVVKYGSPIGKAKCDIAKGSHIHVQNLGTLLSGKLTYSYQPMDADVESMPHSAFMGYRRENGRVGIRNELWIMPTVGCVNDVAQELEKAAQGLVGGGVDAVLAFRHPYGCSQMSEDQENTRTVLGDLIGHPNAGGVLVLGLGCENSGIDVLKNSIADPESPRVRYLVAQSVEDEIAEGMKLLRELKARMDRDERVPCGTEELVVGLKCGGSDGFSDITANPVIGAFSDLLVAQGGSTILTEVPEMFGAETLLMERCKDEATFRKTVALINDFKDYFERHHQVVYENPSPGNKAGGITTLEEKALGCTQKSGKAKVTDVLKYGGTVKAAGLNLLSAPGNDLVASTALAAAGAQIILFSTGRGTPFASPVPTVKISSNTALADRKRNWIDLDAGRVLENRSIQDAGQELMALVLAIANGRQVCSERRGFHDLAIFKTGVTL